MFYLLKFLFKVLSETLHFFPHGAPTHFLLLLFLGVSYLVIFTNGDFSFLLSSL